MKNDIVSPSENSLEDILKELYRTPSNPNDVKNVSSAMLEIIKSPELNIYIDLLNFFHYNKNKQNIDDSTLSKMTNIPISVIERFERLQSFPNILTIIKLFNSVGLTLSITQIEKENYS